MEDLDAIIRTFFMSLDPFSQTFLSPFLVLEIMGLGKEWEMCMWMFPGTQRKYLMYNIQ